MLDREVDHIPAVASALALEDVIMARLEQLTEVVILPGPDGGPGVPVVCTNQDSPLDVAAWQDATRDLPTLAAPLQRRLTELPRTSTWKIKRLELARTLAAEIDGVAVADGRPVG